MGNPKQPPATMMTTAVGKAFGLLYPPSFVNKQPPTTTPKTGPVRAIEANVMKAYCLVTPMTMFK